MSRERRHCEVVQVGGVPVRVQTTGKPLTDRDRSALAELVSFVQNMTPEQVETATRRAAERRARETRDR